VTFPADEATIANFRARYSGLHPLVFQRSLEKASSAIELFEILQSVPVSPPYSWDESRRSWVPDQDVMAVEGMKSMLKKKRRG
jgi:hypothetical protein